jgi:hypothetical protein
MRRVYKIQQSPARRQQHGASHKRTMYGYGYNAPAAA